MHIYPEMCRLIKTSTANGTNFCNPREVVASPAAVALWHPPFMPHIAAVSYHICPHCRLVCTLVFSSKNQLHVANGEQSAEHPNLYEASARSRCCVCLERAYEPKPLSCILLVWQNVPRKFLPLCVTSSHHQPRAGPKQ